MNYTIEFKSLQGQVSPEEWQARVDLAACYRLVDKYGMTDLIYNHITARIPGNDHHLLINLYGLLYKEITASSLVKIDVEGEILWKPKTEYGINKSGYVIHGAIHKARPDVIAAAHAHSMHGRTWSTFGRLLDPITQDACAFYEDHAVFDCYTGVVHETSEGDQIAKALGSKKAAILKNHGLLTVGKSVDMAAWFFISMDRCCQSQLLAEMAGKPSLVPHDVAIKTRDFIASDLAAWASFQPLFQFIMRKHPDLENG